MRRKTVRSDTPLPLPPVIDLMDETNATLELAPLPVGTPGGLTRIKLRVNLPDGRVVLAQTTLRLLKRAVQEFERRYGEVTL